MALTDLPGVGPAIEKKLLAAGYTDTRLVAMAWPDEIAEATGRSLEQSNQIIDAARSLQSGAPVAIPDGEEPAKKNATIWHVLLGVDLAAVGLLLLFSILGYLIMTSGVLPAEESSGGASQDLQRILIYAALTFNLITFGVVPLLWALFSRENGPAAGMRYLGLQWNRLSIPLGLAIAVGMVLVAGIISFTLEQLGLAPESAPIEDTVALFTWPLAIFAALVAGISEEILFRGVLQKWLRWWGQGILFAAFHIPNGGILPFVVVGLIGLGLGYLRHRGMSLYTLIIAHVAYDMVLFSVAIMYPDLAGIDEGGLIRLLGG